jgi:hypothetical protein
MTRALRLSINAGLRASIAGGLSQVLPLVFKTLYTQSGDQLVTQSNDIIGGDVHATS